MGKNNKIYEEDFLLYQKIYYKESRGGLYGKVTLIKLAETI